MSWSFCARMSLEFQSHYYVESSPFINLFWYFVSLVNDYWENIFGDQQELSPFMTYYYLPSNLVF